MPWPKGVSPTKESTAKRVATFIANGAKRKKPTINGLWRCPTCKMEMPSSFFYRKARNPNGLTSQCRRCHQECAIRSRNREAYNASKRRHEAKRRAWAAGAGGSVSRLDYKLLTDFMGDRCLKCGSGSNMQWDHIVPLSRGGSHSPLNLQPLCRKCNEKKNASTEDCRTDDQRSKVEQAWAITFARLP